MQLEHFSAGNNIVLIGMPGVGKSTIGIVLAKMLNCNFVDVDLLIQQRCDKTLQRLIDALGPAGFIEVENEVLMELQFNNTVISTGGSAVYSAGALKHLSDEGIIVYLQAPLSDIEERLSDFTERGVVMRQEGVISLENLYSERVPLYEKCADCIVDVSGLAVSEAARKIKDLLYK